LSRLSLESLLAHNHPITLTINGRKLKICARCSGAVAGFTTALTFTVFISFTFFLQLQPFYQLFFCVGLVTPAIIDWLTQTWRLRESNNTLRFSTGFLEGVAVAFLHLSSIPLIQKFFFLLLIGGIVLNVGFLGRKLFGRIGCFSPLNC
jgi:uncharacterized membrane protein